ncbi:MAG: HD domain-containing protein [Minisyncoccia bacterium]
MKTETPTISEIISYMEYATDTEKAQVEDAYYFSEKVHSGHTRYSGEPYFTHPATVALYLSEMGMDSHTIIAGLLHDSIEDVGVTAEEIQGKYGADVYNMVEGVTKLGHVRYHGVERHAESLRKLFAATAHDVRVILIKLADRLHNARTLQFVPDHKRSRIALETLEVYSPIADRLGMSVMKKDLEDAAFPYAYPDSYTKVRDIFAQKTKESEEKVEKLEKVLAKMLALGGIRKFRTSSRIKGLYSLYLKLKRKEWDVEAIHDIIAIRIIVEDVAACYQALGVVHGTWRPLPGKLKDYVSFPKPNGYQSIHTTVHAGDVGVIEIQIRTEEMHKRAELGLAAHLSYKETSTKRGKEGTSMQWVEQFFPGRKQLVATPIKPHYKGQSIPEWIRSIADVHTETHESTHDEYIDDLKSDFFTHRIFIFTPKGDVIDLPINATPIDFAYTIHSDVGNHIAGARVNGKLVSIEEPLHNGSIVEIITKESAKPKKKWMEIVKTTMARKHIKTALQKEEGILPTPPKPPERKRPQIRAQNKKK